MSVSTIRLRFIFKVLAFAYKTCTLFFQDEEKLFLLFKFKSHFPKIFFYNYDIKYGIICS